MVSTHLRGVGLAIAICATHSTQLVSHVQLGEPRVFEIDQWKVFNERVTAQAMSVRDSVIEAFGRSSDPYSRAPTEREDQANIRNAAAKAAEYAASQRGPYLVYKDLPPSIWSPEAEAMQYGMSVAFGSLESWAFMRCISGADAMGPMRCDDQSFFFTTSSFRGDPRFVALSREGARRLRILDPGVRRRLLVEFIFMPDYRTQIATPLVRRLALVVGDSVVAEYKR